MTIRDCECCPGTFTSVGDEVLCPVCAMARIRDRVASNLDLAVEALRETEAVLHAVLEYGDASLVSTNKALRLVRQALVKE